MGRHGVQYGSHAESMPTGARHIVAQQGLFMLDFFAQSLQRVVRIEYSNRPKLPIKDGKVLQATILHDGPNMLQQIGRLAVDDGPCHDTRGRHRAPRSLADAHLADHIRLSDDTGH